MRIAHLADLHLGFRQYHRQNANGINQREADVANAFRSAVDGVIAAAPDCIIVAGDLFHSVRPTNAAIVFAFRQFQRLREALPRTPIILVAGNHDTPRSSETGSILKLFEEIGVDVAADGPRRLVYPEGNLSVLAVPHQSLMESPRPALRPEGDELFQVLILHGEVEGIFPADRSTTEYGGALLGPSDYSAEGWTYVALGHYHVQTAVTPRVWYSGSLDYVSSNPWGELAEEGARRKAGQGSAVGKGWLLADLRTGQVQPQAISLARRVYDLPAVDAEGKSGEEVNRLIAERVGGISGGIADQIVRLVVRNIPRHVGRELDHVKLREYKAAALHFQLDLRRPESSREIGTGTPGRRATLSEVVREYLGGRPLPTGIDRDAFVTVGGDLVDAAERDFAAS
ncbi:MAG: exonuclease SbcCD subunit D [Gemmatimonadales bacterium]